MTIVTARPDMAAGTRAGHLTEVSGSIVRAVASGAGVVLGEVARVGHEQLLGEVIALEADTITLQVYEDTTGLAPGDPFFATGSPLAVGLGPGLLGAVYDGVERPLERLAASGGVFLARGASAPALDRDRLWDVAPVVSPGAWLEPGAVVAEMQETPAIRHRILVPPGIRGIVVACAPPGPRRVLDEIVRLRDRDGREHVVSPMQRWRVRRARPFAERLPCTVPLITGQRVLDTFFPLPRGGAAGMPGGFGTGKTVMQHQLCQWADADVIVYVGCGERGNEMTEMLTRLPELVDPRTGRPLSERTVLVVNTSNMPVPGREASIYTGVTIAEYYRDMGLHVLLLADSTSRWAEALREISGRLEEMPAEEGYPPYISSRLASFYERAGRVVTLGGAEGSVSLISAISPPGGDLTEPVTRHTQRFTRTFWSLDRELAAAREFPAVNLRESYSHLPDDLAEWWSAKVGESWPALRARAIALLEEADGLEDTARLVGPDSLPPREQFVLRAAECLREGFLRQNALDPVDASCSPTRQLRLLRLLVSVVDRGLAAVERGAPNREIWALAAVADAERARTTLADTDEAFDALHARLAQVLEHVGSREAAP